MDLGWNQIGDRGAQALAQNRTLTSLNLYDNKIGDTGVLALAQNNTLTSLNLWHNQIDDAGAKALAQNCILISLNLDGNQISDAGAHAFTQNSTLISLDLGYNKIGDAGAQALAQNSTLTSLVLDGNQIGDIGAQALAQNSTLTSLGLRSSQIGAAGAQALAQNRTLTSLTLDRNDIGNAGAQALAQNSTLTSLDLKSNKIGAAGAQALAQNNTLTSLNLEHNYLGDAGAQAFAQNCTLISLELGFNQIGAAGAQALCENYMLYPKGATALDLHCINQSQADRFHAACRSGDIATLQSLLEQKQVSPYAFDRETGKTGWHIGLDYRQIGVTEFLLNNVPNPQSLFVITPKTALGTPKIGMLKETDSTTLYLKAARAIESYSNQTIAQHIGKNKHYSSRLFSTSSLAALTSTSTATTTAVSAEVTIGETPQSMTQCDDSCSMSRRPEENDKVIVRDSFSQSVTPQIRKREDDDDSDFNASSQRAAPRARMLSDSDVTHCTSVRTVASRMSHRNNGESLVSSESVVLQTQEEDTITNSQLTHSR